VSERGPRIVDAAKECDRDDDYAEDEADLLWLDAGADGETERTGSEAGEGDDENEKRPAADMSSGMCGGDIVCQRVDDAGGDDALHG